MPLNGVIGTCSLCGGAVVRVENMCSEYSVCRFCGAVPILPHGPIIEMRRPEPKKPEKRP